MFGVLLFDVDAYLVEGEVSNIKITYPYDLRIAESLLRGTEDEL